jgi:hypothetical protein
MSATHWSIAIYGSNGTPLTSPTYSCEKEARNAFNSPDAFDPESLPESYAAVLWEMNEGGNSSALLSKVVRTPVSEPDTWSPGF